MNQQNLNNIATTEIKEYLQQQYNAIKNDIWHNKREMNKLHEKQTICKRKLVKLNILIKKMETIDAEIQLDKKAKKLSKVNNSLLYKVKKSPFDETWVVINRKTNIAFRFSTRKEAVEKCEELNKRITKVV